MSLAKTLGSLTERKKRALEEMARIEAFESERAGEPAAYGYALGIKRPGIAKMLGENPLKDEEFEQIRNMLKIKREKL